MANTLKFGNGQWATGNGTALAYNDENANFKPLPFDFTRASSGTTVNQSGLIETVGSGIPRIDFQGNTKGALLLEPSRTNSVTYSEDFSQSAWTKQSNITLTNNSAISPDGTLNATKVVGNGTDGIFNSVFVSGVISRSIYIKSVVDNVNVILKDPNQTITVKTLNVTTQWQRFELVEDNGTSAQGIWIDDIPSSGIYIWGAQIEVGSYATSYIPTSGSAVTRVAETCSNGANEQVINSTEGVLYIEAKVKTDTDFAANCIAVSDGTDANRLSIIMYGNINSIRASMNVGGVSQFDFNLPSGYIQGQYYKIAVSYKVNDCKIFINGTKISTDTSATMPSLGTFDRLNLDLGQGLYDFYGNVKDVKLYNTALTDAELQALTT